MPPFGTTNCRDRTPEFQAIVQRLQHDQASAADAAAVQHTHRAYTTTLLVHTQGAATSSGIEEINPGEVHRWCRWHYAWQCHKQAESKGIRTHSKLLVRTGFTARTNGTAGSQHSEFARRAARIGLGIHGTSQKLNKLAQLAKRTSMFDDPAAEINDLTGGFACCLSSCQHRMPVRPCCATPRPEARCACAGAIKQDIQAMNAAIADLQTLSSSDYERNRQSTDHSTVRED